VADAALKQFDPVSDTTYAEMAGHLPMMPILNRIASDANDKRTSMGKIIVSENVTLDGVVQDPAGAEGFGRGGWVGRVGDRGREQAAKVLLDEALVAEAQLFGRRTYEFLAARWPSRSGALADRLNSMPKYVVSSTLDQPEWNNSTVLKGNVEKEVSKLKEQLDGEIVIAGSIRLVRTLMEHDLVDEVRLMIYPVVLGAGERLFGETNNKKPMHLVNTQTVDGDLAYLIYQPVQNA
jgi:dihydrofolate reductase